MDLIQPEKYIQFNNRIDFLSLLSQNSICAELGVMTGKFTYYIINNTKPKKLYLIDPYWKLYGPHFWWNNKKTWDCFVGAIKIIQKYDINKCSSFIIDTDISILQDLKNDLFDWVYLDTSHEYEDTLNSLKILKDKVKENGFICGHDYRSNPKNKHFGVAKAINEWLNIEIDYKLYLLDNHTQWIITKK
jgi:hypothetical protein